jgi:hypothetical protein
VQSRQKDYWLNIPHAASDADVMQLAALVHAALDPGLRVYVEWSNEVWNGGLPQHAYAAQAAQQLGLPGSDPASAYQVYRSLQIFDIFTREFAGGDRIVKVLAGQANVVATCRAQLQALSDPSINPSAARPDVYAIAPYLAGKSSEELQNSIPRAKQAAVDNAQCASSAGLPLIAYAGGQDSSAAGSGCSALQHDPDMHGIYQFFFAALADAKLTGPFVHYTHSGACWGLKEHVGDSRDDSPKYQAVLDWMAAH